MNQRGHTLVELLIVLAIMTVMGAIALPHVNAYSVEVHLVGAGQVFKGEFRKARSVAVARGVQTAIRFETEPDGTYLSTYVDGNFNGVLAADIRRGVDVRISGPRLLTTGASDVRVGINPAVPAIPPETGVLDTADPIRFGAGNMVSFSPLGTASPGTFYMANPHRQAAVRVTPGSSRVRLLVCRGGAWVER
jgi:prepilin-type N-terminal cleavage/methylation domain-containing protein